MIYALIGFIALVGSFIQSASGFGYAIICMALWPLLLPFRTASVIEVITAFVMVVYLTLCLRKHINFRLLLWPLATSLLASTFGVVTLMASTESAMRRILGGVLVLLSLYFILFSSKLKIRPTRRNGLLAGLISGFCGGLFNIGGPPMVAYFLSVTDDKMEYNATLQCYFCVTTIYIFFVHLILGNVTGEVLRFGGVAFIGLSVGTLGGLRLFRRLSMKKLRKFVYTFMILAGLYLVATG